MGKYRKKPVEIEAIWFLDVSDGEPRFDGVPPLWLTEAMAKGDETGAVWVDGERLKVLTLEGTHEATAGDWIIRGVKGEIYPCKPDIFALTYDAVEG